jgi:hypothetical protein
MTIGGSPLSSETENKKTAPGSLASSASGPKINNITLNMDSNAGPSRSVKRFPRPYSYSENDAVRD